MAQRSDSGIDEEAFPILLGEFALGTIGEEGLHALAITTRRDGTYEVTVVPEHETAFGDLVSWEHHTGEMNLQFHGRAFIELGVMNLHEFQLLCETAEPEFVQRFTSPV